MTKTIAIRHKASQHNDAEQTIIYVSDNIFQNLFFPITDNEREAVLTNICYQIVKENENKLSELYIHELYNDGTRFGAIYGDSKNTKLINHKSFDFILSPEFANYSRTDSQTKETPPFVNDIAHSADKIGIKPTLIGVYHEFYADQVRVLKNALSNKNYNYNEIQSLSAPLFRFKKIDTIFQNLESIRATFKTGVAKRRETGYVVNSVGIDDIKLEELQKQYAQVKTNAEKISSYTEFEYAFIAHQQLKLDIENLLKGFTAFIQKGIGASTFSDKEKETSQKEINLSQSLLTANDVDLKQLFRFDHLKNENLSHFTAKNIADIENGSKLLEAKVNGKKVESKAIKVAKKQLEESTNKLSALKLAYTSFSDEYDYTKLIKYVNDEIAKSSVNADHISAHKNINDEIQRLEFIPLAYKDSCAAGSQQVLLNQTLLQFIVTKFLWALYKVAFDKYQTLTDVQKKDPKYFAHFNEKFAPLASIDARGELSDFTSFCEAKIPGTELKWIEASLATLQELFNQVWQRSKADWGSWFGWNSKAQNSFEQYMQKFAVDLAVELKQFGLNIETAGQATSYGFTFDKKLYDIEKGQLEKSEAAKSIIFGDEKNNIELLADQFTKVDDEHEEENLTLESTQKISAAHIAIETLEEKFINKKDILIEQKKLTALKEKVNASKEELNDHDKSLSTISVQLKNSGREVQIAEKGLLEKLSKIKNQANKLLQESIKDSNRIIDNCDRDTKNEKITLDAVRRSLLTEDANQKGIARQFEVIKQYESAALNIRQVLDIDVNIDAAKLDRFQNDVNKIKAQEYADFASKANTGYKNAQLNIKDAHTGLNQLLNEEINDENIVALDKTAAKQFKDTQTAQQRAEHYANLLTAIFKLNDVKEQLFEAKNKNSTIVNSEKYIQADTRIEKLFTGLKDAKLAIENYASGYSESNNNYINGLINIDTSLAEVKNTIGAFSLIRPAELRTSNEQRPPSPQPNGRSPSPPLEAVKENLVEISSVVNSGPEDPAIAECRKLIAKLDRLDYWAKQISFWGGGKEYKGKIVPHGIAFLSEERDKRPNWDKSADNAKTLLIAFYSIFEQRQKRFGAFFFRKDPTTIFYQDGKKICLPYYQGKQQKIADAQPVYVGLK